MCLMNDRPSSGWARRCHNCNRLVSSCQPRMRTWLRSVARHCSARQLRSQLLRLPQFTLDWLRVRTSPLSGELAASDLSIRRRRRRRRAIQLPGAITTIVAMPSCARIPRLQANTHAHILRAPPPTPTPAPAADAAQNDTGPRSRDAPSPDCTVGLNAVGEQLLRKESQRESLRKARVKKGKKSSRLDRRKGVQKAAKVKRMILPASPPPASPPQPTAAHRSQKHLLSTERRYKCWLCAKSFKYGAVLELCTHKRIQIDPEQGFCVPCVRAKRLNRLCPVGCQVAAQWV